MTTSLINADDSMVRREIIALFCVCIVEEHQSAFLGEVIFDVDVFSGFLGTQPRLFDIAAPAERQTQLTIGQILDVLR